MSGGRMLAFIDLVNISIIGFGKESYYYLSLNFLLLSFLYMRIPYVYSYLSFWFFLLFIIIPLFLTFVINRVVTSPVSFLGSFVPSGTPLYLAPFICVIEIISYIIRPVVLLLRPYLNLSIGCMVGAGLGWLCFDYWYLVCIIGVWFFYEIFVSGIHWYIVSVILSYSENY